MRTGGRRVAILGAGPAGLGAALGLSRRGIPPILIERSSRVGGNAGSFEFHGLQVDLGSHRLHPSTDPAILKTIQSLLGADLLERPRHGRIRLGGRWIHFPLRPLDLGLRAPPGFVLGVGLDLLRKAGFRKRVEKGETFAAILQRGLGPTVCREFYFPYARKIWGLPPEEISPIQAERRVSSGSLGKLLASLLPGGGGPGGRHGKKTFFYPRKGFGQISEALLAASVAEGAEVKLRTTAQRIHLDPDGFRIDMEGPENRETLTCDHLWSTIPVTTLVGMMDSPPPAEILRAAESLHQRAILLVYLELEQDRLSEFDAHYFPGLEVPFSRISEPKNYSGTEEPRGRTVLCVEIPCSPSDDVWSLDEQALRERILAGLARVDLPIKTAILDMAIHRLPSAYPILRKGYEAHLSRIDRWLDQVPGLVSFGRQGLFAHDNTHHALFTAQAAVDCLHEDGSFNRRKWNEYREIFATHVVED